MSREQGLTQLAESLAHADLHRPQVGKHHGLGTRSLCPQTVHDYGAMEFEDGYGQVFWKRAFMGKLLPFLNTFPMAINGNLKIITFNIIKPYV